MNVNSRKEFDDGIFIFKEPIKFLNEIQELMNHNGGIVREEIRFRNGLKRILELKKEFYSEDNFLKEFNIDDDGEILF